MSSLEQSDREAAAHAVAPRVTLAIENAIAARYDTTAVKAIGANTPFPTHAHLDTLSICIVVMRNGFTEFGKKLAYEDAIRQLWPLMGFSLRDRLAAA